MTRILRIAAIALATASAPLPALAADNAEPPSIEDFVKHKNYESITISPQGKYLAVAAPSGDQTGLVVLDISAFPKEVTARARFEMSSQEHVSEIYWAHEERVLFTTTRQQGALSQPRPTGRLYGTDVDGSNKRMLFGSKEGDRVFRNHRIIDFMEDRPERILVMHQAHDRPRPIAAELNVNDGHLGKVAVSPLDNGTLIADHDGNIRFALGTTEERETELAYKPDPDADWERLQIDFEGNPSVLGFTPDNEDVYIRINEKEPMGIYRLNPRSGDMTPVVTHDRVEASATLPDMEGEHVIGAVFYDGEPEMKFIDPEEETSRLQRSIAKSFGDYNALITSFTDDGKRAIVRVSSDRLPEEFFLFDIENTKVTQLLSSRAWLDPQQMSPMEPISFEASDGMEIPGYLTIPKGTDGKDLPLVVYPHGGPHGVRDYWGFNHRVQLLASRGYAVLQINYRGSGGYGLDFQEAGYREWGRRMQDDITDGTRWAIDQGIADPDRVCLHGGSYGGYATAMGLIREPELYQCGFAVVGVYSLPLMFEEGNIQRRDRGKSYLRRVLGTDMEELKARSPVYQVEKIEAPIYLSHGSEDEQAHYENYHLFVDALEEAGKPHEKQWIEGEGHGYYEVENRVALYSELFEFLDEHIGE